MLGWNYRITEFQAAVLLAQLERLPEQVSLRAANVAHLERRIAELEGVSTLPQDERMTTRSGYGVVLRYDERAWRGASGNVVPRDRFAWALHKEGMKLHAAFYTPVYSAPLFAWRNARIVPSFTFVAVQPAMKITRQTLIGNITSRTTPITGTPSRPATASTK